MATVARRPALPPPPRFTDPGTWGVVVARLAMVAVSIVGAGLLLGAGLAPAASVAADVVRTVSSQMLDYPPLPDDLRQLAERSIITDRDGTTLAVFREENRKIVRLQEVPLHVRQAVIATEDQHFYDHNGVNWPSVVRAAAGNMRAGAVTSGASTITQQVVKNLVLESAEQTVDRKLREAVYALELERRMSKDAILEEYLNTAYLGNGVYGLGAAADYYWGKPVSELTVDQGALLAGMLRSPERNEPVSHPAASVARRNIVLQQMVAVGFLTPAEGSRFIAEPLELAVRERSRPSQPFVVDYARAQLLRDSALGPTVEDRERLLNRGGLTIRTTIHPVLQEVAREAIHGVLDRPEDPLAALTAVNPRTGEIMAIGFGPTEYGTGPGQVDVNPAVPDLGSGGRQPGSSFKTFAIVAALEAGISPAYTIDTPSPYVVTGRCPTSWQPGNYSDSGGGIMNMAEATARSSNIYFAHLVDQVIGPETLAETARRMGIRSRAPQPNCAAVLGSEETYPLDMASAFGTLANRGVLCEPFIIAEVVDRTGRVISRGGDRCSQVVAQAVADRATALLRGPIDGGTASRNGRIGRPAAGKTGTSDEYKNAWFVGYIPQLSTGVWVGYERNEPMRHPRCSIGVTGGCLPTEIWASFMRRAVEVLELPVEDFPAPPPLPVGTVPDVLDRDRAEAEQQLAEARFTAIATVVEDWRPEGTVITQNPAGGTTAPTGTAVLIQVSDGNGHRPLMPSLIGLAREDAEAQLAALRVRVRVAETPVDDVSVIGVVVEQDPVAGSDIGEVEAVTIVVGRARTPEDGPPPAPSPPATAPPPPPPPVSSPPPAVPSPQPTPSPTPAPTETAPPPEGGTPPGQGGAPPGQGGSPPGQGSESSS
jgi:membrane peptidoglycan carboxypeptidase